MDQALSLTSGSELTIAIAEEITGSISLAALDQYVAAILAHDATAGSTSDYLTTESMAFRHGLALIPREVF